MTFMLVKCRGAFRLRHDARVTRRLSGLAFRNYASTNHGRGGQIYFIYFIARWPTVGDLAAAEDDEVMGAGQASAITHVRAIC